MISFDWTFNVGHLLTIAAIIVAALSAFFIQRGNINTAVKEANEAKEEAKNAILRARELGAELANYRLEVSEKYATHKSLEQLEERIIQAVERIGDRLDRVFERTASQPRPRRSTD